MESSEQVKTETERLYKALQSAGVDVLLDDRDKKVSPGVKFADMDLIGIPHRVVIGDRGLDEGQVEYKYRRESEARNIKVGDILAFLMQNIGNAREE
jgi:prolyl-tRNA synthetase